MKKFLILTLILLTSCSSTTPINPAPEPAPLNLTVDSASGQIQQAMLSSAARWRTIQMSGDVTWYASDGTVQTYQEQAWIDPLNGKFKVELNGAEKQTKTSNGTSVYNLNVNSGQSEVFLYPAFARVGQYIPPLVEGEAHPNPIWAQIGTPLSQLAFSSDYAQNRGIFKPVEISSAAGRETLVVEWMFSENSFISWRMWLDTQTAVILKLQEFGKDGNGSLQGERTVTQVIYDQTFAASLFALPGDSSNGTGNDSVAAVPVVTESGPMSEEEAGELYFFLQPRQAGQSIQLVRVSGMCVSDVIKCPPVETIQVPFAFNFTINALSWSPDGRYAAFSYSDAANGTPTRVWLFDASAKTWTSLAQFPYIDPPFWSRDGQWIAFRIQDGKGGEEVYIVHPDGRELKNISASLPVEGRPYIMDGWYMDGRVIMRSALPGEGGSIYLVSAANGEVRPMFDTMLKKASFVASPDAGLLAYDDFDYNSQSHSLKVMNPDGANAVTLADFTGGNLYPLVWSPDGNLIAFNYYRSFANSEPGAEVYVVSRNGENLSLVYKGVTVGRLIFSPNGKYLLVEETTSPTGGHLFLINLATMQQKILEAPGLSTDYDWYAPSWRP
ncbi:MAG: PD40 domain-containing protein [Chloroflexi bacterium]|nr:PD40 domain-containing protein [Chloroflexota bacterium]